MRLFDSHLHLDEESFDVDRAAVVKRAEGQGVALLLTLGTTLESSRRAVALSKQFPGVYAAVGVHPNYAAHAAPGDWEEIERLATEPRVVAIGETGLDLYWKTVPLDTQRDWFRRQITLAQRLDKPFSVHCREAEAEVVEELRRAAATAPLRGVMHSFAGSAATARSCLSLGMHISFSGMVTYKKSAALRELLREIPADRILVETDAPYLPPQSVRGKRNEPAFVRLTAEAIAAELGQSLEVFSHQTTANACRLFGVAIPDTP
ncbi:MAG: TatD family deoxyribonuclease [Planctomycetaceae bacterium]|nr:MAG: TatD family deoxyribonuclease [Planctomycetaceae bacterium]